MEAECLAKGTIDYDGRTEPAEQPVHVIPKGLCSTCVFYEDCTFCGSKKIPVMYCEEFTDKEPLSRNTTVSLGQAARAEYCAAVFEKDRLKGLCVNCGKNRSCRFEKPEEGVWHCEEYC